MSDAKIEIVHREAWATLTQEGIAEQIQARKDVKNLLSGGWLYGGILDREIEDLEAMLGGRQTVKAPPTDEDVVARLTARIHSLEAEVARYKEREAHFAKALSVADGGQYRNDWDGAIARVIRERNEAIASPALLKEHARLVTKNMFGGGLTDAETLRLEEVRRVLNVEEAFLRIDRLARERDQALERLRALKAKGKGS